MCMRVCVCMASNAVHNDVLINPPKVAEIQWNYLITVTSVVPHVLPYKCHVCRSDVARIQPGHMKASPGNTCTNSLQCMSV